MNKKIGGFGILCILLMILMSFTVSAKWDQWQNSPLASGLFSASTGEWTFPLNSYSGNIGTDNIQPLIHDFDGDNIPEIITTQATTIAFYRFDTDYLNLIQTMTVNDTIYTQGTIYENEDGDYIYGVVGGNVTYLIAYNFTSDSFYKKHQIWAEGASDVPISGVSCFYSENTDDEYCVWIDSLCQAVGISVAAESFSFLDTVPAGGVCSMTYPANNPVHLESYYGDGENVVFFAGDYSNDGNDDIVAINPDGGTPFETRWDGNGVLENANVAGKIYSTIAIPSGTTKIGITGWKGGVNNPNFALFNNDGSTYATNEVSGNNNDRPYGTMFYGDFLCDNTIEYCSFSYRTTDTTTNLYCYNSINGSLVYGNSGSALTASSVDGDNFTVASAVVNSSTGKKQIIASGKVWDISSACGVSPQWQYTYQNNYSGALISKFTHALSDINYDGSIDDCYVKSGTLVCFSSTFSNDPPVINNFFGQNFDSPVCTGTTVTFTGYECGGTQSVCDQNGCSYVASPCTYTNDASTDNERLVSNCGIQNNGTVNGSYSLATPEIQCTFNNPTTYYVNLYLQDQMNPNNYSNFETKTITVINGTAGIDCNFPVSSDVLNPPNIDAVDDADQYISTDDLDEATDVLFSQSPLIKFIFVLVCTLMLMGYLASLKMTNPIIQVTGVWILWLIFALIGVLSYVYLVIFSVVIGGLVSVMFILGRADG